MGEVTKMDKTLHYVECERCHYQTRDALFEEIIEILKEMAQLSYFDEAEGPELRAQNAQLHRLAAKALSRAQSSGKGTK